MKYLTERLRKSRLKLGFDISESTVIRYLSKKNGRSSGQRWNTFLKNHAPGIVSIDFIKVPIGNYKLLYVLVFPTHQIRKIIQFIVTAHPTAECRLNN